MKPGDLVKQTIEFDDWMYDNEIGQTPMLVQRVEYNQWNIHEEAWPNDLIYTIWNGYIRHFTRDELVVTSETR